MDGTFCHETENVFVIGLKERNVIKKKVFSFTATYTKMELKSKLRFSAHKLFITYSYCTSKFFKLNLLDKDYTKIRLSKLVFETNGR